MLQTASNRALRHQNEQQLHLQLQHQHQEQQQQQELCSSHLHPPLPHRAGQLTATQGSQLAAMTSLLTLGSGDILLGEADSGLCENLDFVLLLNCRQDLLLASTTTGHYVFAFLSSGTY